MGEVASSNIYIEKALQESLLEFEKVVEADVLTFIAPVIPPLDAIVRDAIESKLDKRKALYIILETDGGYIETAERIVNTTRRHYAEQVDFVIPSHAFSAGTVLASSGNRIWMDYFSVLGPIDPQISIGGRLIPALGYVEKYNELIKKADGGELNTAEMAYLIQRFDPAEIYHFEEAKKLSVDLLKEWLVKYKFRDWQETRDSKKKVTSRLREARAVKIAKKLGDPSHWHSHGRGISMSVLENDVGLIIHDFEHNFEMRKSLHKYYRLLKDYMMRRAHHTVVHIDDEYFSE
jgi:hypothetical protein